MCASRPSVWAERSAVPLSRVRREMRARLLPWFKRMARDLPWRDEPRPAYAVWVSEIMLQQTRVDTVIPYFQRFMQRFPTPAALAAAPVGDVLKLWEGLGYYSRARNLHAAAQQVVARHGGVVPDDPAALAALPGLGNYTIAAIASFAFHLPLAVLDGNVMRVLTRLTAWGGDIALGTTRKELQQLADALLLADEPGACNEAWMELGALICTPKNPDCPACPMQRVCQALAKNDVARFPVKQKAKPVPHKIAGAAVLQDAHKRFLVLRRPLAHGLLAGLWHFPAADVQAGETPARAAERALWEQAGIRAQADADALLAVRHAFSHFTLEEHVFSARRRGGRLRAQPGVEAAWITRAQFAAYAFGKVDLEIIRFLQKKEASP